MTKDYPANWRGRQAEILTYDGHFHSARGRTCGLPLREKARRPTARAQTQMIQKRSWDCIILYHHRAASQLRKAQLSLHLRHTPGEKPRGPTLQLVSPSES